MDMVNILFVDDERFTLAAMARLLFKQTYNKFFAVNGQEALEIMATQPIHVIVSDMRMPGIDGLKLLTMVKDLYPDTIRMVLSAYAQTSQLLPCINRGEIFRFITKPLDPNELKTSINDAIELSKIRAGHGEQLTSLRMENTLLAQALEEKNVIEEQLQALSVIDEVTGLYNRRQFTFSLKREFDQSLRYQTDFSCIMIDIDHFKDVNDTFGHGFGDVVLKTFSKRLKQIIRETDIAFRYGGDEFFILLPSTNIEEAVILGQRIVEMCRNTPYDFNDIQHVNTVSVGVTSYEASKPAHPDDLIESVDGLLYESKQTGRNRLVSRLVNSTK